MATKPKTPRLRNLPKRPKSTASLQSWENYAKKVTEVQKNNRKTLNDYNKAVKNFEAAIKSKAKLIERTKGLGKV